MAKFNVEFDLHRDDDLREDDETFFEISHIESEIISWLDDLDFKVKNIRVQEWKEDKNGNSWVYRNDRH
tara:strand:+ start:385 stop:591 length:207 start_codon:yes stop_codon:yes gene_type:complete